jgi:hypothetical protein
VVASVGAIGSLLFLVGVRPSAFVDVYGTERNRMCSFEKTAVPLIRYAVRTDGFAEWIPMRRIRNLREEPVA